MRVEEQEKEGEETEEEQGRKIIMKRRKTQRAEHSRVQRRRGKERIKREA